MFADVGIDPQRTVVAPLDQVLLREEVDRQDSGVATIATSQRERSTPDVRERGERAARRRYNQRGPAKIGVPHGEGPTRIRAPFASLQERQIGVPRDVDLRPP